MEGNDEQINKWISEFTKYLNYITSSNKLLNNILSIKKNIINLMGKQDDDDIIFYKGLINNSYYFYSKSLDIRKKKMLRDLNSINNIIDKNDSINEINKTNFEIIIKKYIQLRINTGVRQKNNTKLTWVKSDIIESLYQFESDMDSLLKYHIKIISFFEQCLELETIFFCGNLK